MKNKNITYLIGAGASCNSMPLVNNMNKRIDCLFHLLNTGNQTSDNSIIKNETYIIYHELISILNDAKRHKTLDTYAKKLWLTKQTGKLHKLKVLLDLYFTFEQDISKKVYKNTQSQFVNCEKDSLWRNIGEVKDYRYDVFMATLLSKELTLPTNINIVSWNYDNQIELGYSEFLLENNLELINKNLRIAPLTELPNESEIYSIVKLNGQVNLNMKSRNENDLLDKLNFIIKNGINEYPVSISFAWESSELQESRINLAKKMFYETFELIIIGYSFPYFNRAIDKELFSNFNNLESIKVQCPTESFASISTAISEFEYWESNSHFEKVVKLHNDIEQFYIPSRQLK